MGSKEPLGEKSGHALSMSICISAESKAALVPVFVAKSDATTD